VLGRETPLKLAPLRLELLRLALLKSGREKPSNMRAFWAAPSQGFLLPLDAAYDILATWVIRNHMYHLPATSGQRYLPPFPALCTGTPHILSARLCYALPVPKVQPR
jgi:hypothetical protein